MKIIARGNQDEQCCKIVPHRCALNLLRELSLGANCVFLAVRTAQLDQKAQEPGSWVSNHMPAISQVTLRKSLLPLHPVGLILLFKAGNSFVPCAAPHIAEWLWHRHPWDGVWIRRINARGRDIRAVWGSLGATKSCDSSLAHGEQNPEVWSSCRCSTVSFYSCPELLVRDVLLQAVLVLPPSSKHIADMCTEVDSG